MLTTSFRSVISSLPSLYSNVTVSTLTTRRRALFSASPIAVSTPVTTSKYNKTISSVHFTNKFDVFDESRKSMTIYDELIKRGEQD